MPNSTYFTNSALHNSTSLMKIIGENIETTRLLKKKSIKEMASLLGLTHTGYRNIERGKTEINITKVFQIANILNVPFSQLLDIENNLIATNVGSNKLLNGNKQHQENDKQLIQHYKEEISFLRKQLELTYSVSKS